MTLIEKVWLNVRRFLPPWAKCSPSTVNRQHLGFNGIQTPFNALSGVPILGMKVFTTSTVSNEMVVSL